MNFDIRNADFESTNGFRETKADLSVRSNTGPTGAIKSEFTPGEFVVYPAHGVGRISEIEIQTIAGACLEFFVIYFAKSKMRLRVPVGKAPSAGMRKLSSFTAIERARRTLCEAPRRIRSNWSQLIRECEAKIKSGDIVAIAEATRDLHRRSANSEQSYSERQLYIVALGRLAEEVALVEGTPVETAVMRLESVLLAKIG